MAAAGTVGIWGRVLLSLRIRRLYLCLVYVLFHILHGLDIWRELEYAAGNAPLDGGQFQWPHVLGQHDRNGVGVNVKICVQSQPVMQDLPYHVLGFLKMPRNRGIVNQRLSRVRVVKVNLNPAGSYEPDHSALPVDLHGVSYGITLRVPAELALRVHADLFRVTHSPSLFRLDLDRLALAYGHFRQPLLQAPEDGIVDLPDRDKPRAVLLIRIIDCVCARVVLACRVDHLVLVFQSQGILD